MQRDTALDAGALDPNKEAMEVDRADVDHWLRAYIEAWKSNDRDQIGALFSDGVTYRYHPFDEPIVGRKALVDSWLGEGDYGDDDWVPDEKGTYEAAYRAVAVDGEVAVATGISTYFTEPGGAVKEVFHNCFVMRFDSAGLCRDFTEWFMRRPSQLSASQ